ncbi:9104_t:CDS:10, partial [Ambispora gerdemannii]
MDHLHQFLHTHHLHNTRPTVIITTTGAGDGASRDYNSNKRSYNAHNDNYSRSHARRNKETEETIGVMVNVIITIAIDSINPQQYHQQQIHHGHHQHGGLHSTQQLPPQQPSIHPHYSQHHHPHHQQQQLYQQQQQQYQQHPGGEHTWTSDLISNNVSQHHQPPPPGTTNLLSQSHNYLVHGQLPHLQQHNIQNPNGPPGAPPNLQNQLFSEQPPLPPHLQHPAPFQGQLPPRIAPSWDQRSNTYRSQILNNTNIGNSNFSYPPESYQSYPPQLPFMTGIQSTNTHYTYENKQQSAQFAQYPPQSQFTHLNQSYLQDQLPPASSYPHMPSQITVDAPAYMPEKLAENTIETKLDTSPIQATPLMNRPTELYEKLGQVGEGTFGKVYKARNRETGSIVALKKIRMEAEKEGFPLTALREIKLLQSLRNDHIVTLLEIMVTSGVVYMVFEYMDHDLTGVLANPQIKFEVQHIKCLMKQLLEGLVVLHERGILHRDIKGSNLLLNNRGQLKLGDFGLARKYDNRRQQDYTNRVVTLWYRPPELCLGATEYGPEVDMWSAGCILMELFTRKPLFQGVDELTQLENIFQLLGSPSPEEWPHVVELPWYDLMTPATRWAPKLQEKFEGVLTAAAMELAEALLSLNPENRPTARKALNFSFFTEEMPTACSLEELPEIQGDWHEYESKQRKRGAGNWA